MQQQQPPPPAPIAPHLLLLRAAPSRSLDFSTWASNNPVKLLLLLILLLLPLLLPLFTSSPSHSLCPSPASSRAGQPPSVPLPALRLDRVAPLPLPPLPTSSFRSPNWIVLFASAHPPDSPSLLRLARIRNWQLLALADSLTPPSWSLRGAIFLSLDHQALLGYRSLDYLPYRSHLRKSAGYLFAIQHGARRIFDADSRATLLADDLSRAFSGRASLRYARRNRTVLNPYSHFGQRSVWPRGLPLESAAASAAREEYYYEEDPQSASHFVLQGLSDGLPDVDSIFYFTRKARGESFDVRFDADAPVVAVPPGLMVPVNSLNTMFHWEAFWGLMLPVSVSVMSSDVLRGYWMQRLLWEIGGNVAIHPPTAMREDNAETYPFSDERDLHVNVRRLVQFLVDWRSEKGSFFERILDLSHAMVLEGFWKEQDLRFTADWLQDLIAVGYKQPELVHWEIGAEESSGKHTVRREFVPRKLPSVHLRVKEEDTVSSEIGSLVRWRNNFGNVVLVVYCSGPPERTALEWRLLYGRIFRTVVILSNKKDEDLAVESADMAHTYKYLPKIFDRFPQAEGFLFLHDTMILNYWNLLQADKGRLWIADKAPGSWITFTIDDSSPKWRKRQAALVKKFVSTMPAHFQISYKASISEDKFALCGGEIFYIPQRFVADFRDLVELVGDLNLHHKMAVPLFFMAMDSPQNFDSDALREVIYGPKSSSNTSCSTYYSANVPAVYPCTVQTESEFVILVRNMATGDPLLMELF